MFLHFRATALEPSGIIPVYEETTYWRSRDMYNPERFERLRPDFEGIVRAGVLRGPLVAPWLAKVDELELDAGDARALRGLLLGMATSDHITQAINAFAIAHTRRQRNLELTWERVRGDQFSTRPSRRRCLFLFDARTVEEGRERAHRMGVYDVCHEVELVEPATARVHTADARWLDHKIPLATAERGARYWRGDMTGDPMVETLIEGAVRVVRVHA